MSQTKNNRQRNNPKSKRQSWIPLAAAAGGVLLIVLAFLAIGTKPTSKAGIEIKGAPSLKADREVIDLGDMKFNQTADVSFRLTNVGDQNLQLTKDPYIEVVEGC